MCMGVSEWVACVCVFESVIITFNLLCIGVGVRGVDCKCRSALVISEDNLWEGGWLSPSIFWDQKVELRTLIQVPLLAESPHWLLHCLRKGSFTGIETHHFGRAAFEVHLHSWGLEFMSSCLQNKHSYPLSHLASPLLYCIWDNVYPKLALYCLWPE